MRLSWCFLLLVLLAPSAEAVRAERFRANRAGGQRSLASATAAAKSHAKKKTGLGRFARAAARRSRNSVSEELEAPPSERRYWMSEWIGVESELLQLGNALGSQRQKVRPTKHSEVQLTGGAPSGGKGAAKKPAAKASNATKTELKELADIGKGVTDTAALVPMLGMLKSVYEDAKARIGKMNAQEKASREKFAEMEAVHKRKMADIEGAHRNRTEREAARLSHSKGGVNATATAGYQDELYRNETKWEDSLFAYRQRSRDRQHRQYHNMLKLTHATMEKEKKMIEAYEAAISAGKKKKSSEPNSPEMRKVEQTIKEMPDVVLLQRKQEETLGFVEESLLEVRRAIRSFS